MADFPQSGVSPLFISSIGFYAGMEGMKSCNLVGSALASISWGTSSLARYVPFWLPWPYTVRRVFWGNGSSAAGNTDVGIYTMDGTKVYSTAPTVQSGASVLQYVTPTAFVLAPGRYYMAMSNDGTTSRAWGLTTGVANNLRLAGWLQQASAGTLPATATFALYANTAIPLFGITRTASGF